MTRVSPYDNEFIQIKNIMIKTHFSTAGQLTSMMELSWNVPLSITCSSVLKASLYSLDETDITDSDGMAEIIDQDTNPYW